MMSLPRWTLASAAFLAFPAAIYLKNGSLLPYRAQQFTPPTIEEPEYKPIYTNASFTEITCTPSELNVEKECVYTSLTFWHSRGLSICTTPSIHAHISSLPGFTDSSLHLQPRSPLPSVNTPITSSKYPFYVAPLPGKGMSVLASSVILPGTEILSEHPALLTRIREPEEYARKEVREAWTRFNKTMIDSLPERTQKEVNELATSVGGPDIPSSVLATNAFQVEIRGVKHAALFPMVSRMNHDCRPNVIYVFSPSTLTMTLRTLRRVETSEELTISYIPADRLKTAERLENLDKWGFRCLCHQCTLPDYLADESDHRVQIIGGLRREFESTWKIIKERESEGRKDAASEIKLDFEELAQQIEYYLTLHELERLVHVLPHAYLLAARLLSRARSSSPPSAPPSPPGSQVRDLPLTPAQIYVVLKYVTLATGSGLNTFGKNWGVSYNEMIRIEGEMQEMLVALGG